MKNYRFRLLLNLFLLAIGLTAVQSTWAMRCLSGPKASSSFNIDNATNKTNTTNVGTITVTNFNSAANALLWESQTYSSTFTCYDDATTNSSEDAYLYVDDAAKKLATDFGNSNLIMGIRFNGQEYPITQNTGKILTGKQALRAQSDNFWATSTAANNCRLIGKYATGRRCADPQTITLTYSLYIKARGSGSNFPAAVKTYDVFQLDGEGGRNGSGNFQEKVSGIQIKYVECVPVLNTQTVDLGQYYAYQDTNTILRKTPFSINVITNGKDCAAYPFVGIFSSAYQIDDQTITAIETDMKDVIGIRLFESGNSAPLKLNDKIDFGYSSNTQLTKNFEAGVLFLKKPANAGKFTSVINYEVYFK
ncbi:fimbrial protein [Acinetobacter pragensis]|uniref:fimbrial protein n=1 Tax=Acinetobacter pragensis TaxID=1806892 RepID=UPI00333E467A